MNVHSSRSGFRRGAAKRAFRRYGGALWTKLPVRLFEPIIRRIDNGLLHGSLELHLPDDTVRMLGGREQGFTAIVHLDSFRALIGLRRPARWAGSRPGKRANGPVPIQ